MSTSDKIILSKLKLGSSVHVWHVKENQRQGTY